MPVGLRETRSLFGEDGRALNGDGFDPRFIELEHDISPCRRYRVVEVDDGTRRTCHAFKGFFDQVAA